jgi:tRNA (mo5U34)-methyltransferase
VAGRETRSEPAVVGRRRVAEVVGIDHDRRYLAQARLAAEVLDLDVEFRELEVYDVAELGRRFDYVLFLGVLYHLRHPLLALDRLAPLVGERLVVQSLVRGPEWRGRERADAPITELEMFHEPGFPALYFIEHSYAGDPTNWWVPNEAGLEAMIRSAGLEPETRVLPGVWFCRPGRED